MPLVNFLDSMLGIGTFLLHICLIVFFSSYIYYRVTKKIPSLFEGAWEFIKDNSLTLAFLMTFGATIISLIYSEIIGYEACVLCWYQRTLIYPQVIILGVALLNSTNIVVSAVPVELVGARACNQNVVACRGEHINGIPVPVRSPLPAPGRGPGRR